MRPHYVVAKLTHGPLFKGMPMFCWKFSLCLTFTASLVLAAPVSISAQSKPAAAKASSSHIAQAEAHQQMRLAVAKAHAEKKGVLIKFSASWCGPCHAFDRFLFDTSGVGAIMQKYFVIVGMTALENPPMDSLNTPGAPTLADEMGGKLENTGIPYFFTLDGDGKKTGDSNVMPDHSNIGYPEAVIEVAGFDKLLQAAAPHMTADEHARIKKFLDKAAGRP